MTARRLPAPLHPSARRGRPVTLIVDGRRVPAHEGEPVAVALLAAGRPVLSRSFRLHRPRGLMCSTGQCGWCECRIDGRPSVRSCRVPAMDGLSVESEHAFPTASRDLLGVLDRGSRWVTPAFYHHRFLRPKRLRKRYLDVIRWFGGRGRLTVPPRHTSGVGPVREARTIEAEVAVVGGGPAGLLAARAAADAGARVVLLDGEPDVGGPWRWRADEIPGTGSLGSLVAALAASGRVTVIREADAVGVDAEGLHAVTPDGVLDVRAGTIIAATGSYERLPLVPGNDRPGVLGARTVEWLVRAFGVVPGARAVLVGSGPDLDRAADALVAGGSTVVARTTTSDLIGIDGGSRVRGIRVRRSGATERLDADLVVVGDRVPADELVHAARGSGASTPVLVAGAADGRPIRSPADAEAAAAVGRAAAERAAAGASGRAEQPRTPVDSDAAKRVAVAAGSVACFCEDVRVADLVHEREAGYAHPELLKRRTGALTGPCQGKYCGDAVRAVTAGAFVGSPASSATTSRPPARPVRLGDLVARALEETDAAAGRAAPR